MPESGTEIIKQAKKNEAIILTQFLTEVLYNKKYLPARGAVMSRAEILEKLARSPQGTLIVAADTESALSLYDGRSDVFAGAWPKDPRCFNSICILPSGEIPGGYRDIIWAGMPAMNSGIEADLPRAEWMRHMPGVDDLRKTYVAAKRLLSRPVMCDDFNDYAASLGDESALDRITLLAGLFILMDMGLIVDAGGCQLKMGEFRKVEPDTSEAFHTAIYLKEEV